SFSEFGIEITLGEDFGYVADDGSTTDGDSLPDNTVTSRRTELLALDADTIDIAEGSAKFMVSSSGSYGNNDTISLANFDLTLGALGLSASDAVSLATRSGAESALTTIDSALTTVAETFGQIG